MGFVPRGSGATVTLGVVAYGVTERLSRCLESLITHESLADFDVVCVVNPTGYGDEDASSLPHGVEVILTELNLGWAGGLHAVRHATSAEWLGWIQDDSVLTSGWLDALLEAAETRPRGGAFGAQAVDADGRATGFSGGDALPFGSPGEWNDTDPSRDGAVAAGVERREWVTSKGLLVRASAWDDVGGPCPLMYPLHHVDKEFSAHLRCHGWELYLVPQAQLLHLQSQSAPGTLRGFLEQWRLEPFAARWEAAMAALAGGAAAPVDHPCHAHPDMPSVEREVAWEATRMLVPFSRFATRWIAADAARLSAEAEHWRSRAEHMERSSSWRVTAPLRALRAALGRVGRR